MEKRNPTDSSDVLAAGTRIGGYTLSRKISEGGMGEVYEGVQRALKRRVAVKLLAEWATGRADLRARFLREGETAARIRHHNIVEIYDVGVWGDRPYIVMEYLDGRTLEELMQLEGPLPEAQVVDLMLPVLSAISAANDRGIIHRDLKPENIFIADMDSGVEPKVLDFGISRIVTSHERIIDSQNVGTPHYMSPEQARGEAVDARSDQYSIAIVLYEMVTGHLPRDHETVTTLMRMVAHDGFVHPREYAPDLSDAMVSLLMKGLARKTDNRFDDLQDMMLAMVPLASERARSYWQRELTVGDEPGRVTERPPPSGSHRSIVGGPAESSTGLKALEGEETHSEIVMPAGDAKVVTAPVVAAAPVAGAKVPQSVTPATSSSASPDAPDEDSDKKTPWLLILSAAIVLLAVGGWFATNGGDTLDTSESARSQMTSPSAPAAPPVQALDDEAPEASTENTSVEERVVEENAEQNVEDVEENVAASESSAADENTASDDNAATRDNADAPGESTDSATRAERIARAERRAARAETRTPPETPSTPSEPTMSAAMNPTWEPSGSSDNVDPWN
ncbi:MAG: protein kinase [Polyangiales bacterium]